jgi:hypothetical protein
MTMNAMSGDGKIKLVQPVWKQVKLVALATALILLIPLVAMQFTKEVAWNVFDFAVAGVLLGGTGLMYVFAARMIRNAQHRFVVGAVLAVALLLVWAELAVGIIGSPLAGS